MKRILIAVLFSAAVFNLSAEVIEPYITAQSEAEINRGMAVKAGGPADVLPLFKSGVVMNTGSDPGDPRNFGTYVETFTEISYEAEGEQLIDLIFVVYSNLSEINVKQGDMLAADTVLGQAYGPGTPVYGDNRNLFIYIYTVGMSPYLLKMTKGRFIQDGDFIWWDPGFLVVQNG